MKEHPILFSGAMVRAILDGRKTQTRRVMKLQIQQVLAQPGEGEAPSWAICNRPPATGVCINEHGSEDWLRSPYGYPGDRLWVRETWANNFGQILYRADCHLDSFEYGAKGWKPSIHMPRKFSRIALENKGVRVERLQDISEEDAKAEGVEKPAWDNASYRCEFMRLWDEINPKYPWESNPWVWVIEFKRVKP